MGQVEAGAVVTWSSWQQYRRKEMRMRFIGKLLVGLLQVLLSIAVFLLRVVSGALSLFLLMFLMVAKVVLIFAGAV